MAARDSPYSMLLKHLDFVICDRNAYDGHTKKAHGLKPYALVGNGGLLTSCPGTDSQADRRFGDTFHDLCQTCHEVPSL